MERAIAFENRRGERLAGVLATPEPWAPRLPVGVLLLPAGRKVRAGPWRMAVLLARRLAQAGVSSLRFDYSGVGDSEGPRGHGLSRHEFYVKVESGEFVGDALCAAQALAEHAGASRLVFAGLCGGAVTALQAGPARRDVFGYVLVDLPVTLATAPRSRAAEPDMAARIRQRPVEAEETFAAYAAKLRDPGAWRRLWNGQSDRRLIAEALRQRVARAVDDARASLPDGAAEALLRALRAPARGDDGGDAETVNERIPPAFRAVVAARQRVLFLNSSSLHPHFMAYFGDRELPRDPARARGFEVELVRDTNHIFSFDHARAALASAVERMALRAAVEPALEEPAPAAGWDRLAHLARRALARTATGGPA